jgi:hypothetical protein
MDHWACVDDLHHILLLEIGNQTSKVSVEVNHLRNEFKTSHDANIAMGAIAVQRAGDAVRETFSKTLVDFLPGPKLKLIDSQT